MGRQPPMGLTPFFLYSSITSWFWSALLRIAHAEVLVLGVDGVDLRLERLHLPHRLHVGKPQREQDEVDHDGDHHDGPAEVVHESVVEPVDDQEQRLGQNRQPAEIHHLFQLGVDALEQVDILGADEQTGTGWRRPSETAAPANGAGFSIRTACGTVSLEGHLLHGGAAFRQEDGGEIGVFDAGEREIAAGGHRSVLGGAWRSAPPACSAVASKYSGLLLVGAALATVRSPKPPRHSIMLRHRPARRPSLRSKRATDSCSSWKRKVLRTEVWPSENS